MERANRIEFFIVKKCINNCVFCSERDKFDGSELSLKEIRKRLTGEKQCGVNLVHFMGGEPTIHSKFDKILILSKSLGFRTHIITNGIKFSSKSFCDRTLAYLDEIKISIHGHNSKIHDANTRNRGSFKHMIKGFDNLAKSYKHTLMATTTITKINCSYLLDIARLINKYGIKDLQFISIIPSGEARRNFFRIIPRFNELKSIIGEVIRFCDENNITARFAGLPMCTLGGNYVYSSDLWEDFKVKNIDTHDDTLQLWKETAVDNNDFEIDIGRIKTKKCKVCDKNSICGGIYNKYYQQYSDLELAPFV